MSDQSSLCGWSGNCWPRISGLMFACTVVSQTNVTVGNAHQQWALIHGLPSEDLQVLGNSSEFSLHWEPLTCDFWKVHLKHLYVKDSQYQGVAYFILPWKGLFRSTQVVLFSDVLCCWFVWKNVSSSMIPQWLMKIKLGIDETWDDFYIPSH